MKTTTTTKAKEAKQPKKQTKAQIKSIALKPFAEYEVEATGYDVKAIKANEVTVVNGMYQQGRTTTEAGYTKTLSSKFARQIDKPVKKQAKLTGTKLQEQVTKLIVKQLSKIPASKRDAVIEQALSELD
tara:strand:+ start:127 stop:513 length:387 start_codon:yes stop_codon:yes gene_type:complete